ncbi:MAG TPA: hypothetical protein VF657_08370 [Actinoplanes sp.]|jgi:hypothetical protein
MTESENERRVRLNDEERDRVTDKVQSDRIADASDVPASVQANVDADRDLTTDRVRADRQEDMHLTTDQVRADRQEDEAPREALELVRADRLERTINLMETVRALAIGLLVLFVVLGIASILSFRTTDQARQSSEHAEETTRMLLIQQKAIACDLYANTDDGPPEELGCP